MSAAEHLGIHAPKLTPEHAAGLQAAAAIGAERENASIAAYEAQRDARRKAEAARDEYLWQKIVARTRNAVG